MQRRMCYLRGCGLTMRAMDRYVRLSNDKLRQGASFHLLDPFGPNERWLTDAELIAEEFMKYANGEPYTPPPTLRISKIDYEKGEITFDSV